MWKAGSTREVLGPVFAERWCMRHCVHRSVVVLAPWYRRRRRQLNWRCAIALVAAGGVKKAQLGYGVLEGTSYVGSELASALDRCNLDSRYCEVRCIRSRRMDHSAGEAE